MEILKGMGKKKNRWIISHLYLVVIKLACITMLKIYLITGWYIHLHIPCCNNFALKNINEKIGSIDLFQMIDKELFI